MPLVNQIASVTQQVTENFSSLNEEQLNWKSAPEKWSIAQCLDHLIVCNSTYFPVFESIIANRYEPTFWERINPLSGYIGKKMIKALGPVPSGKFTAPKLFSPASGKIDADIMSRFLVHQDKLIAYADRLLRFPVTNIIISSPVNKLFTFSLLHALEILTGHEQRHINQALNIQRNPHFPVKTGTGKSS